MLTRQKSGLIIMGDIKVTGLLDKDKGKGKGKGKNKGKGKLVTKFMVMNESGESGGMGGVSGMLHSILRHMSENGRVIIIPIKVVEKLAEALAEI